MFGFTFLSKAVVSDIQLVDDVHCINVNAIFRVYQRSFMAAGSLTLGGNMSLAVGPLGRNGEASTALSTSGKVAAMFVLCHHCPFESLY